MSELVKIEPENLEVANAYLSLMDTRKTASELNLPLERVEQIINTREVRRYIDTVFMDVGYNNRYKLQELMDDIIDEKLEDMQETEMVSTKDIAELIALKHKMRMQELEYQLKANPEPKVVKNTQINNYGENYGELMNKLLSC